MQNEAGDFSIMIPSGTIGDIVEQWLNDVKFRSPMYIVQSTPTKDGYIFLVKEGSRAESQQHQTAKQYREESLHTPNPQVIPEESLGVNTTPEMLHRIIEYVVRKQLEERASSDFDESNVGYIVEDEEVPFKQQAQEFTHNIQDLMRAWEEAQ